MLYIDRHIMNFIQVDVVYVGNLHVQHKKTVLMMFQAGKPVLCEKPLTIRSEDTAELIAAARANNVFLMEVCPLVYIHIML